MPPSIGYVYVFNASVEIVRLWLNNSLSTPIAGVPLPGASPTPYRPFQRQIQRQLPPSTELAFLDGQENAIALELRDCSKSNVARVRVPAPSEATEDLWLYVTYELLLLLTTEGKITARADLVWAKR